MATDEQIVREALSYIDAPDKWTKGVAYRDADGLPMHHNPGYASSMCSIGALRQAVRNLVSKAYHYETEERIRKSLQAVIVEQYPDIANLYDPDELDIIPQVNDDVRFQHSDVVMVFEKTAARLGEQA
jgi:hypothetical protein